ncbi:hypothetical protein [Kitasatospora sp. NPDC087315]|uniref:hypothetical protein n=1 Tax=Kitasatospora sp. NPDC087315 TaxID=3364069 RepID=UPI003808049B
MRTTSPALRAASLLLTAGLAGLALGTAPANADPGPGVEYASPGQGEARALSTALAAGPRISRSEVLSRAKSWVSLGLDYSWSAYHDGYRQDCSGYASMAWKLGTPGLDTTSFIPSGVASRIGKEDLRPGDALLNDAAGKDGHIVLFDRWANAAHTSYLGYEFSGSGVHHRTIPYPYFPEYIKGNGYAPVRNNSIVDDTTPPPDPQVPASSLVSGKVATVYNPDTKTAEAFAIDTDGHMRHSYSTDRAAWSAWLAIDDSFVFTGSPAAVYNPVSKVAEVFATGAAEGIISHSYLFNGGAQWSSFRTIGDGFRFGGSPAAVYNATTNAIELFGIGKNGVLNHTYNLNAGAYDGWESLDSNKKFAVGTPAALYNPDTKTAEVFATGTDGTVVHNWSTAGGHFQGWDSTNFTGFTFASNPAVAYNPVNKVTEVYAVGGDGVMSHNYLFNGSAWHGWETLDEGFRFGGSPAAVYNATTNAMEVFGIGKDGVLNHTYNLNAGAYQGWESLNTKWAFTGTPSALYEPDARSAEVFAIGSADGKVSHSYTADGKPMSPWYTIDGVRAKTG